MEAPPRKPARKPPTPPAPSSRPRPEHAALEHLRHRHDPHVAGLDGERVALDDLVLGQNVGGLLDVYLIGDGVSAISAARSLSASGVTTTIAMFRPARCLRIARSLAPA
jgi:hypothetical protein